IDQMSHTMDNNTDNTESIVHRPHSLHAQFRAKSEVQNREGKLHMINQAASQGVEHLLQLSAGKRSRSAERKRATGRRRHEDHNNFLLNYLSGPGTKVRGRFVLNTSFCRASVSDANT